MSCKKTSPNLVIDLLKITEKRKKPATGRDRACDGQCSHCPRKRRILDKHDG